jgi:hypothetical protein
MLDPGGSGAAASANFEYILRLLIAANVLDSKFHTDAEGVFQAVGGANLGKRVPVKSYGRIYAKLDTDHINASGMPLNQRQQRT